MRKDKKVRSDAEKGTQNSDMFVESEPTENRLTGYTHSGIEDFQQL